jgi:hypothetical protein
MKVKHGVTFKSRHLPVLAERTKPMFGTMVTMEKQIGTDGMMLTNTRHWNAVQSL